jgi:hypothetical protein
MQKFLEVRQSMVFAINTSSFMGQSSDGAGISLVITDYASDFDAVALAAHHKSEALRLGVINEGHEEEERISPPAALQLLFQKQADNINPKKLQWSRYTQHPRASTERRPYRRPCFGGDKWRANKCANAQWRPLFGGDKRRANAQWRPLFGGDKWRANAQWRPLFGGHTRRAARWTFPKGCRRCVLLLLLLLLLLCAAAAAAAAGLLLLATRAPARACCGKHPFSCFLFL